MFTISLNKLLLGTTTNTKIKFRLCGVITDCYIMQNDSINLNALYQ